MRPVEGLASPAEAAGLLKARWAGGRANPLAGKTGERLFAKMRRRSLFTLRRIGEWLLGELGLVANDKTLSRFLHAHGFGKRKCGSPGAGCPAPSGSESSNPRASEYKPELAVPNHRCHIGTVCMYLCIVGTG